MTIETALRALSLARTALDDPWGLPPEVGDLPQQPDALKAYAIDRIDWAMNLLSTSASRTLWERDDLQFPRLLAELMANVEFDDDMLRPVAESMDLQLDEVLELFNRAQEAWERIKSQVT